MDEKIARTDDWIDEIVHKYSNMVYRLALSQTRNRADADDVFQEVFLRYVRHAGDMASEEHTKAWLIRVTINCSRSFHTAANRRRTLPLDDDIVFSSNEKRDVFEAVAELPKKYRAVIHLYYYEGYSTDEIASILRANPSTVRSWLCRARGLLKEKLGGFAYEESSL